MDSRRVTLGRVSGVWGIKGWLRVHSYTRPPENLLDYRQWRLEGRHGGEFRLVDGRLQGKALVVQLARGEEPPIEDRDQAVAWIGAEITVPRAALPPLPPGEVYWADLIGCSVFNEADERLGVIDGLLSNGPQDVLVVRDAAAGEGRAQERMIPFVRGPIVKQVDVDAGRVIVDWQLDY